MKTDKLDFHNFFSLPKMREEYYSAEKTTGIFTYTINIIVLIFLFNYPPFNKITGISPYEFYIIVGIHATIGMIPYLCFQSLHKFKYWGIYDVMLIIGITNLFAFFSGSPNTFIWMFYFLMCGIEGNGFGFNFYNLLIVSIFPFIIGYMFAISNPSLNNFTTWGTITIVSVLGTIFNSFIGIMSNKYFYLLEKNFELEKKIVLEKERNRLSREIHDGISSEFTRIISFTEKGEDIDNTYNISDKEIFQKIRYSSQRGLNELRNIILAADPESESLKFLAAYLKRYCSDLFNSREINLEMQENIQNDIIISSQKVLAIIRIVQEACHNTIKHSGAKGVKIKIFVIGKNIEITIEDNGKGFDPKTISSGNGFKNMQKRCEEISGKFDCNALPGEGTKIKIHIPITPTAAN